MSNLYRMKLYLKKAKVNMQGQITIQTISVIAALIASIGAPFIWAGDLKSKNDVQDVRLGVMEKNQEEIKTNVEYIRRTLEEMRSEQKSKTIK